jgi:uncharacterized membrane protein YoaK (UPF0700 family)
LTHINVAWHGCRFKSSAIRVGRATARRIRHPGARLEWALLEAAMLSWLFRILMLAAGAVTGYFVAKDSPNFGVVQMMVALLLLTLFLLVLAFWPRRWSEIIDRKGKFPPRGT